MKDARSAILFVANSLRFGGAEKHTVTLLNHLDVSRFRLGLAYLKREEQLLPELDANRLAGVYCPEFGRGMDWRGLVRLTRYVRHWRPDVLVCVNQYPLFFGYLARLLSGVPCRIVEIFHTTEMPKPQSRNQNIFRWFFNRCDRIVYVSRNQRQYWEARGLRADRGEHIHNGIDTAHFRDALDPEQKAALRSRFGLGADDFVVGICAALRPEKRHEDLLEAIALLRARGLPAKCLILGDGPQRAAVEAHIAALRLDGHVVITGFQADVRPCLGICDCVALVSDAVETFSLAALEAMALGKPVVMSDIGGASEQVMPGENGFLFSRRDVEQLAEHLWALSAPEVRARLGAAARETTERRFSLHTMIAEYGGLFHLLSADNRGGRG